MKEDRLMSANMNAIDNLSPEELKQVQMLEKKLDTILVAYRHGKK